MKPSTGQDYYERIVRTLLYIQPRLASVPTRRSVRRGAGMHGLMGSKTRMIGIVHDDHGMTPGDRIRFDAAAKKDLLTRICVPLSD